ncbi:UNVERIFIED_CONTAM: Elongator subunit elp4 [Siphonaria sp. JEL0065]|nr:Elongator subunit elp4 [Siphonaria sp. JEL0065]
MSGFRKRTPGSATTSTPTSAVSQPTRGTRISGFNGKSVCSFGVASLDASIGEMPVGSVFLVLGDRGSGYAALIKKYLASQAVACGNVLCSVGDSSNDPEEFVKELFKVVDEESTASKEDEDDEGVVETSSQRELGGGLRDANSRLSIAWRYQGLPSLSTPKVNSQSKSIGPYCCMFDITQTMNAETLDKTSIAIVNVSSWVNSEENVTAKVVYSRLFDSILEIVNKGKFRNSDASVTPNLLRIVIQDIGGPFWGTDAGSQTAFVELIRFLGRIRGLIRDCRAVLVVGLRGYLFDGYQDGGGVEKSEKSGWLKAVMHAVDGVLEVESFSGTSNRARVHARV